MDPSIPIYGSPEFYRLEAQIEETRAELDRNFALHQEELSRNNNEINDEIGRMRSRLVGKAENAEEQTHRIGDLFKKILAIVLVAGLLVGTWAVLGTAATIAAALVILSVGYFRLKRQRLS